MARLDPGTLCIVVRDTRAASLLGLLCTVVGHVEGVQVALFGDHVVETRHGDRYVTWRANLQPIGGAPASACAAEPMAEAA